MKATLINKDEVKNFIESHGRNACVCYNTNPKYAKGVGKSVLESGHMSGSRGIYFTFEFKDVPRSCYDEDTEILTNKGWKYFRDVSEDEVVATRNWESGKVEFNKINEKIEYIYEGDMHFIKSNSVDLAITSNHNILYQKCDTRVDKDKMYLEPVEEVNFNRLKMTKDFIYENELNNDFIIKGYNYEKKTNNGGTCTMYTGDLILGRENFYKLLAWYLSDGSTYYDPKENKYVISISQTQCNENIENKTREDIYSLIEKLGFTPTLQKNRISFNSLTLGRYFKSLGISHEKSIPFDIYSSFNKSLSKVFLNEYFRGDGHIDKNGCGKLYTTSPKLADQLQQLAFISGWTAMVYKRGEDLVGKRAVICNHEATINHIGYVVNVTFSNTNRFPHINMKKHHSVLKNVVKKVYCVNVKNNVVFVRRKGKAVWCGNCVDQAIRHDVGTFKNVQSFRYVNMNDFSYYTAPLIANDPYANAIYKQAMDYLKDSYGLLIDHFASKGIKGEKVNQSVRGILPMNTNTSFVMGFTAEALFNFMNKRLCTRAEEHIRKLALMMKEEVLSVIPEFGPYMVADCEKKLFCDEGKYCCGRFITKEDMLEILSDKSVQQIIKNKKDKVC